MPSLLPFFIPSALLRQLGPPGVLGRLRAPVTARLFGIGAMQGLACNAAESRAVRVSDRLGRRVRPLPDGGGAGRDNAEKRPAHSRTLSARNSLRIVGFIIYLSSGQMSSTLRELA